MAHETKIGEQKEGRTEGEEARKEIAALLSGRQAFVTYTPLRTEVPWNEYVQLPFTDTVYTVSPRASLDPLQEALAVMNAITEKPAAILIPGRQFDASGTRHGQGGGWYDRFLARVPRAWLRIGFCFSHQFSATPLVRESWDQAMDAIIVVDLGTKSVSLYTCTA